MQYNIIETLLFAQILKSWERKVVFLSENQTFEEQKKTYLILHLHLGHSKITRKSSLACTLIYTINIPNL